MSRTIIISELLQISPTLADLPPLAPYQVPAAYFETLPAILMDRVTTFSQQDPQPAFSTLSDRQKQPWAVPAGYFDTLADTIIQRIRATEAAENTADAELAALSPLLKGLKRDMPFSVPEHYFTSLAASALPKAEVQENTEYPEAELPAFLKGIRQHKPYKVPQGYFEQLPQAMLKQVARPQARVISMTGKRIMRFAVAASVAAVAAVSGWFFLRTPSDELAFRNEAAYIQHLSNQELQDFADKNTVILPESTAPMPASADINDDDIKVMLAGVPDNELQQYLDQQTLNTPEKGKSELN